EDCCHQLSVSQLVLLYDVPYLSALEFVADTKSDFHQFLIHHPIFFCVILSPCSKDWSCEGVMLSVLWQTAPADERVDALMLIQKCVWCDPRAERCKYYYE